MNVFILEQITLEDLNYPVRETVTSTWGIYSSLDKAYEALQTLVAEENKKYTLGYIVTETRLDNWATLEVSIHTYTRTGELNDEQIISDEEHPDCDKPFYGRPKEKIRFKPGDIVEVWQGGTSELHIVCALPWTPQEVEKRNKRLVEEYGEGHELRLDSIDDCYLVYSLGIGDTHGHSQAAYLFAPTQKVPAKIRLKLQAKLIEENFTAGHNLQMSELPFAKDPKVLNEVLNIWEKVAKTKDYDEINCLLIRDKADWIKSQLDFSPKQAQRFDRFYTKCKKLLKEKRKEEVY